VSPRRRRSIASVRSERGLSLIEMLIAITISGIIATALTGAIYFGFQATGSTETRLSQSGKANLLASYFVEDVQNATGVGKGVTESAAACGAGAMPVALLLTQDTATPSTSSISYFVGTGANSTTLYRRTCDGGIPGVSLPVIKGLRPNTLTFACAPLNPPNGNPCVNTNPSNGIPDWTSVTVNLTQQQDASGKSPYATTLVGSKRVS
jgi:prepilin-type N-terminal cleavage/methylation domain-containing protein